jgi:hypothetical protein
VANEAGIATTDGVHVSGITTVYGTDTGVGALHLFKALAEITNYVDGKAYPVGNHVGFEIGVTKAAVAGIVIVPHVVMVSPGETTNNVSVSMIIVIYEVGGKPAGMTSGIVVGTNEIVIVFVEPDKIETTAEDGTEAITYDGTLSGTLLQEITADVESIIITYVSAIVDGT